jgi:hypothetical protein
MKGATRVAPSVARRRNTRAEFKKGGARTGRHEGLLPPAPFRSRRVVEAQSSLALVRGGKVTPVALGDGAFSMRIEPAANLEAPIVFAGYGLQVAEATHDEAAGKRCSVP